MTATVGDFDYTQLAGLRGKRVTLRGVLLYKCGASGSCDFNSVEIPRLANLCEELAAAARLRTKTLGCSFVNGAWSILVEGA